MVKLYVGKSHYASDLITGNDAFFDRYVSVKSINGECRRYMKEIDNAEIIDEALGTIQTPFGVTSLENLSTGCKTVLNLNFLLSTGMASSIDLTECGTNALDAIFETLENHDNLIKAILGHAETYECQDRLFCVNDTFFAETGVELSLILMRLLGQ